MPRVGHGEISNALMEEELRKEDEDAVEEVRENYREHLNDLVGKLEKGKKEHPERSGGFEVLLRFIKEVSLLGKKADTMAVEIGDNEGIRQRAVRILSKRSFGSMILSDGRKVIINNWNGNDDPENFEKYSSLYVEKDNTQIPFNLEEEGSLFVEGKAETDTGRKLVFKDGKFSIDCTKQPSSGFILECLKDLLTIYKIDEEERLTDIDVLPGSDEITLDFTTTKKGKKKASSKER